MWNWRWKHQRCQMSRLSLPIFLRLKLNNFIWNRQEKRSFPACGAAVELHYCTLTEKPHERRSAPEPGGGLTPSPSTGTFAPWTPFRQCQICYDKDVIFARMCTYAVQLSAIELPLLGRQICAFSSLFQINYRIYLGSQTVYTRMQFYRPSRGRGRYILHSCIKIYLIAEVRNILLCAHIVHKFC